MGRSAWITRIGMATLLLTGTLAAVAPTAAEAVTSTPAVPTLASKGGHSCAVVTGGVVSCWGENTNGELGDSTTQNRTTPVVARNLVGAESVGAGDHHSCAVTISGTVYCWGQNTAGQLGDGTTTLRKVPTLVSGVTNAKQVAAGLSHTCAVLNSGRVDCWGQNTYGQLGDGSNTSRSTFVEVQGITNAVWVSTGNTFSCAVLSTGAAQCWGGNSSGQLGNNDTANAVTPVAVSTLSTAVAVASGSKSSCATLSDGTVACWGDNSSQQLGDGTSTNRKVPVPVSGLTGARVATVGDNHACAVLLSGAMKCWGENINGKLGDGTTTNAATPVSVAGISSGLTPTASDQNSCVRLSDGTIKCWGLNSIGQVGDGTTTNRLVPTNVLGFQTVAGGFTGVTPYRLVDTRGPNLGIVCASGTLQVAGVPGSGVPQSAASVALNVTIVNPKAAGFLTIYPSDASVPTASNVNYTAGQVVANNVVVKVSGDGNGTVTLFANAGCPDVIVDVVGSFSGGTPAGGGFTGITPYRAYDSRNGDGCLNGTRPIPVQSVVPGIPGTAVAAAFNITVVTPKAAGYVTAFPSGAGRPNVSTLNYVTGQVVPNGTLLKLGNSGQISLFANAGCPDVVVDVVGWFASGTAVLGGFVGIDPARILDTRSGPACTVNPTTSVQVAGGNSTTGVPTGVPANASAVALNVTAVAAFVPGYITAYPAGVSAPTASTVNYRAGQIVPNGALVKVGSFAADSFTTNGGCPNVIVDINGYFAG